jgi:tetratricopeptide (TPR) repeat protein
VECLRRYQEADPGNPNTYDSLGEVHYRFGEFATAEQHFLEAIDANPDFQGGAALVKAARCRLMMGDRAGADELFEEYATLRRDRKDASIELRGAQWQYWTGRGREAVEALRELLEGEEVPTLLGTLANTQLAAWSLIEGRRDEAREYTLAASNTFGRGLSDRNTVLCQFLLGDAETPQAWQEMADRLFPRQEQSSIRAEALTYVYLLNEHFENAIEVLEERIAAAAPFATDEMNVMLGWAALETGETVRAATLLRTNPILQPGSETPFHSLVFPRIFLLRGLLEREAGSPAEAIENLRRFLEYSGNRAWPGGGPDKARAILEELGS